MKTSEAIEILRSYLDRTFGNLHDAIHTIIFNYDKHRIHLLSLRAGESGLLHARR